VAVAVRGKMMLSFGDFVALGFSCTSRFLVFRVGRKEQIRIFTGASRENPSPIL
jgi:hypothetical protein